MLSLLTWAAEVLAYLGGGTFIIGLLAGYAVHRYRIATGNQALLRLQKRCLILFLAAIPAFLLSVGAAAWLRGLEEKQLTAELNEQMAPVIKQVRELLDEREFPLPEKEIPAPKAVLVWDMFSGRLSGVHFRLPRGLRARGPEESMTIFLIAPRSRPRRLDIQTFEIRMVLWPEKRVVGRYDFFNDRGAPNFDEGLAFWRSRLPAKR